LDILLIQLFIVTQSTISVPQFSPSTIAPVVKRTIQVERPVIEERVISKSEEKSPDIDLPNVQQDEENIKNDVKEEELKVEIKEEFVGNLPHMHPR
jgi:hypothetical protein